MSPRGVLLSLHQKDSNQLSKVPVGVGSILLMGPSHEPHPPDTPLLPTVPPLPQNLALGFVLPAPTESGLGPDPDDLMCVSLSGSPRAASPPTVLKVELAGLDSPYGCSVVIIAMDAWGTSL